MIQFSYFVWTKLLTSNQRVDTVQSVFFRVTELLFKVNDLDLAEFSNF